MFLPQLMTFTGFSMGVNYGLEKVRFPAPVPVGARLRAGAVVDSVTDIAGGVQVQLTGDARGRRLVETCLRGDQRAAPLRVRAGVAVRPGH
jgi:acyl dehydratase